MSSLIPLHIGHTPTMHLLNLTLSPPTAMTDAVVGSFSGTKGQEILAVRGGTKLEILKLNANTGQCESASSCSMG